MGASMNGGFYQPSRPSSPSNNRGSVSIYPPSRIDNEGRTNIFREGETFFNGGGLPAQQPNSGVGKYSFGGRGSPSPPRFPWSGISAEIKQNGGVFSGHFGPSGGSGAPGAEGGEAGEGTGAEPEPIDCEMPTTEAECVSSDCCWDGVECDDPGEVPGCTAGGMGEPAAGSAAPELTYLQNKAPDAKSNSGNKKVPVELHSFLLGVASVLFLGALLTGFRYAKNRKPRSKENVNLDYRLV